MTKVTGWDNGLSQDYDKGLGRWFANRLGARQQLRQDFEMTHVIIDRATLEQLVAALNEVDQHVDLKRYDTAPNEVLFDVVVAALTVGREALAKAEPTGWQKIETAPEGTMILCANMKAMDARSWAYVAWIAGGKVCGYRMDMPTHWMPLPTPPKEQQ